MTNKEATQMKEKAVGPLGLKFSKLLSGKYNGIKDKQVRLVLGAHIHEITIPETWSINEVHNYLIHFDLDPANNFSLSKGISSYVSQLRWWGESYGYFNRKSDAAIFASELEILIKRGIIVPSPTQLAAITDKKSDPQSWYIDPETIEAKQVLDSSRYVLTESLDQLEILSIPNTTELPLSTTAPIAALNVDKLKDLPPQAQIYAGKLLVVSQDIIQLMSAYSSEAAAESTYQTRPIIILFLESKPQLTSKLVKLGAISQSYELALLHKRTSTNTPLDQIISEQDFSNLEQELDKADKKYLDYARFLSKEDGMFNTLLFTDNLTHPLSEITNDLTVEQIKNGAKEEEKEQQIDNYHPTETIPEPAMTSTPKPVEQEQPVKTINPIEAKLPSVKETLNIRQQQVEQGIIHKFNISGTECILSLGIDEKKNITSLNIAASKVSPIVLSYLSTINDMSNKILSAAPNGLAEVVQSLDGLIFEPNDLSSKSIPDYCAKWIKQNIIAS